VASQDRYSRMTTKELEDDAAGRSPAVDLSSASTNEERAKLLRSADEITGAGQDTDTSGSGSQEAPPSAAGTQESGASTEPIKQRSEVSDRPAYERAEGRQQPEGDDASQRNPADPAPYPSDEDRQNRVDAASGVTSTGPVAPEDVPPVGGEANQPGQQQ
jgi:hypothetical protein